MTISLRLVAVMIVTALVSAGCLDFSPPPSGLPTPTRTPTATLTPEPTATVATATATSTSTPEPTLTATVTPFNPFASPSPSGSNGPGIELIPPAAGLGTPLPGGTLTGATGSPPTGSLIPTNPGSGTLLPPIPGGATGASTGAPPADAATATPISWTCHGDERIMFVPEVVSVNEDLLITVSSGYEHGYTLLVGPQPLERAGQGRGGPGYYWQWKRKMDKPGLYRFEFLAGPRSESRCITGEVRVIAGGPPATPTPIPATVPTATPTPTPRPDH